MDGFERRRKRKEENILQAALSLFIEFGVQKVRINEIADKANVSQVTIYNYFENKDKLVDAVIIFYIEAEWVIVNKILDSDHTFPEKIKQLNFNKKEIASNIHENFFKTIMENAYVNEYVQDLYVNRTLPKLVEFFDEGRRDGYVDPSLSNEAIMFYFQMIRDYTQKKEVYNQILHLTEEINSIFMYGIMGNQNKN